MAPGNPNYCGRFAPSPTGPLHLGSLIAALASYLDARHYQGSWLVRMEDLDPPREQPGAAHSILNSLLAHGLQWDGDVCWQSTRSGAYDEALAALMAGGQLFFCDCSRRQLGPAGSCEGGCRERQTAVCEPRAARVAVAPATQIHFADRLQGAQLSLLGQSLPDFAVGRKDGLYAYQLAVVVDDAYQDITHIVRGSDLLDSTPRQILLQQMLGKATPDYLHVPVITNPQGQKFSKQNHAPALASQDAPGNLRKALRFLCQATPPSQLTGVQQILRFACEHWSATTIPPLMAVAADNLAD